jgi:predicted lipid-binding transport protein (Tim44 family)
VILALSILGHRPLPAIWRLLGPLLGGLVGGLVMKLCFPDQ